MSSLRAPLLALLLAAPAVLPAWRFWPDRGAGAIEKAGARFRAGDLSGAAQLLEPLADKDGRVTRELLALRFLAQDFEACEALALSRSAALDGPARFTAARAAAARGDWPACLRHLDALPVTGTAAALALRAEALDALGDSSAAAARRRALSATAGTRLEASTQLWAGGVAEAAGRRREAEACYKAAEAADPSYSVVHARLARLYLAEGRLKDARVRLERARRVDPDDEGLRQSLNQLLAAAPGQRRALQREEHQAEEAFLARPNPTVAPQALAPGEPLVRVGLLDTAPRFKLVLGGPYVEEASGRTLTAQSAWLLRLAQGGGWELHCVSPAGRAKDPNFAPLRFSQPLRLRPLEAGSTFGLHGVDNGAGYFWAGKEDRYYRGLAELRPQGARGLTLVNELGLEAYLLSVVPSEIRAQWPAESLKAQAIAARTDAWRSRGRFKAKGYDLCPTVLCAAYSGVGAEDARTTAAVTATAGLVLEQGHGRLAATFYMHSSGGHTQDAGEAWAGARSITAHTAVLDAPADSSLAGLFPVTPASLLAFIDDDGSSAAARAWGRDSSAWRWTLRLGAAELEASVRRRHPAVPPLRAVLPLQRSAGGYVERVRFIGAAESEGTSDYIRSALKGLRSNLFYAEPRLGPDGLPREYLFHGGGWGHGVGMAQTGARSMAEAGFKAGAILDHYFRGSRLRRRYGP